MAALCACALARVAHADAPDVLPSPLHLSDVLRYAGSHRAEIRAAQARERAASERPNAVSGLEDPVLTPALNHLPYSLKGANWSVTLEQRFPLSGTLGKRQRVAEAEHARMRSERERVALDVTLRAAEAYLSLRERRAMARIYEQQKSLAEQVAQTAAARYASAASTQAEALRAEIEVARLSAAVRSSASEIRAAEIMLNANLGRPASAPLPELADAASEPRAAPSAQAVRQAALARSPELQSGQAEIRRYRAEAAVMESMYIPMAMVRTGPAYTMMDGPGWMLELGVSLPLWRGKLNASVSEAKAMVEMAQADVAGMRNLVEGEALAAREELLGAEVRYVALRDEVVPRAQQAVEPAIAAYASGQLPLVSVIESAQALWSAQAELVSAELALGLASARLARALGTPGGEP